MRLDEAGAGQAPSCAGFQVSFDKEETEVRLLPGNRLLPEGLTQAVLKGLLQAPQLLGDALGVLPPRRAWQRVEVKLQDGDRTEGEALALGKGKIRLSLGEAVPLREAERIARHEALHLLLAASQQAGPLWNDPELAFAEWIVRGIESCGEAPRFRAPLPQILARPPASRIEVLRHLASPRARHYFGEPLFSALSKVEGEQRKLWIVEAALGTHFLEAAARVEIDRHQGLRAVVLDDWLFDYEQYVRGVANPPAAEGAAFAGNLWRLSDPGWSRDALTRLSAAAQALQREDHSFFSDGQPAPDETLVWKNRGRVRLPILPSRGRARPHPIHAMRAVLGSAPELSLLEQAARGGAALFEARALWPRVLARMLAAGHEAPMLDPPAPVALLQIVDSDEAFAVWSEARAALCALLGDAAAWVPEIAEPRHLSALAEAPPHRASTLLVHAAPPSPASLLASRRLAAERTVRGALFKGSLDEGRAHERASDCREPLDPRYREEIWRPGPLPQRLADLPRLADEATQEGRLTTPLSHLLAAMGIGLEECHYPAPRQR
jgi:hypothetical protein